MEPVGPAVPRRFTSLQEALAARTTRWSAWRGDFVSVVVGYLAALGASAPVFGQGIDPFAASCGMMRLTPTAAATLVSSPGSTTCEGVRGPITLSPEAERVLLLRFEAYFSGVTARRAGLRLPGASATTTDDVRLTADWYDWGETCEADDLTAPGSGGALDATGACGTRCDLLTFDSALDLALEGVATHVTGLAPIGLRVRLDGTAPTGTNAVNLVADWPLDDVYLVLETCAPGGPLPSSCEVLTFPAAAEASTLAQGVNGPPVTFACTPDTGNQTLAVRDVTQDVNGDLIRDTANTLLLFDTTTLPVDQVPLLAALRLDVRGTQYEHQGSGTLAGGTGSTGAQAARSPTTPTPGRPMRSAPTVSVTRPVT